MVAGSRGLYILNRAAVESVGGRDQRLKGWMDGCRHMYNVHLCHLPTCNVDHQNGWARKRTTKPRAGRPGWMEMGGQSGRTFFGKKRSIIPLARRLEF